MIIYEAHRGLYELTVYVSKTNKGHTRPTAATAEARSKKNIWQLKWLPPPFFGTLLRQVF